MTIGEKLLDLSAEYNRSKEVREDWDAANPVGREPQEIAADYEKALRELLAQ